jgi:hypothetical protein
MAFNKKGEDGSPSTKLVALILVIFLGLILIYFVFKLKSKFISP